MSFSSEAFIDAQSRVHFEFCKNNELQYNSGEYVNGCPCAYCHEREEQK